MRTKGLTRPDISNRVWFRDEINIVDTAWRFHSHARERESHCSAVTAPLGLCHLPVQYVQLFPLFLFMLNTVVTLI